MVNITDYKIFMLVPYKNLDIFSVFALCNNDDIQMRYVKFNNCCMPINKDNFPCIERVEPLTSAFSPYAYVYDTKKRWSIKCINKP